MSRIVTLLLTIARGNLLYILTKLLLPEGSSFELFEYKIAVVVEIKFLV